MSETFARYVFLDVVSYTSRPIEHQAIIVKSLQEIVKEAVNDLDEFFSSTSYSYLPTGDGMCIVAEDENNDEKMLKIALRILELLHERKRTTEVGYNVRIGLDENKDIKYDDINGEYNFAGRGINMAQRIMSVGDGGNIMVSPTIYERLVGKLAYQNAFVHFQLKKKNTTINCYQYINKSLNYLNNSAPTSFK